MAMRYLRRRRCPLLGGDTAAFCASLVEGLAHLESTLNADEGGGGGGSVSMRWCVDAMRLVKRMQSELLAIFKKAGVPAAAVSYGGGGGGDVGGCWFEHYMQETAALLDFCNAFKSAVSRLHRYCMVVDFAAQVGCHAAAAAASLAAESSDASCDVLPDVKVVASEAERLGRKIMSRGAGNDDAAGGGGGGGNGMVVVTLVAKITMSVVSMFVLRALTSPVLLPITDDDDGGRRALGGHAVPVPELQPWRESLAVINDRFPRRAGVAEHKRVAMVVKAMANGKEEEEDVELLRTRSGELRESVEMFDCVLDQVFDEVIKGRNEMLGIFRDKALELG